MSYILLVEDDDNDATIYGHRLGHEMPARNIDVVRCSTIDEAYAQLKELKNQVETIILDLNLGQLEGVDAVKGIRSHETRVPVIVLTGYSDHELLSQSIIAGANDYLVKGRDDDKLVKHTEFQIDFFHSTGKDAA